MQMILASKTKTQKIIKNFCASPDSGREASFSTPGVWFLIRLTACDRRYFDDIFDGFVNWEIRVTETNRLEDGKYTVLAQKGLEKFTWRSQEQWVARGKDEGDDAAGADELLRTAD